MKEGGGGGEGKFPSFLPHPLPAYILAPFFARSLLGNSKETLATQAIFVINIFIIVVVIVVVVLTTKKG